MGRYVIVALYRKLYMHTGTGLGAIVSQCKQMHFIVKKPERVAVCSSISRARRPSGARWTLLLDHFQYYRITLTNRDQTSVVKWSSFHDTEAVRIRNILRNQPWVPDVKIGLGTSHAELPLPSAPPKDPLLYGRRASSNQTIFTRAEHTAEQECWGKNFTESPVFFCGSHVANLQHREQ